MKCPFLYYVELLMISPVVMASNPIHHLSLAKIMKCSFFGLHSTSDNQLGWSMDSNPVHHLSPAKKTKCSFLDYFQLLMISQAGQWTQILYTTSLQPKNEMPIFGLDSTSEDQLGRLMDSNLICHTSPAKK